MKYDSRTKKIKSFKDLNAWKEGHKLAVLMYKITNTFPKSEIYGLTNQLRRASISVTSNIAEGFGRKTYKEKLQFFYQSQGSLLEIKSQLLLAKDIGYQDTENYLLIEEQSSLAHKTTTRIIHKN